MASTMKLSTESEFSDVCKDGESVISSCKDAILKSLYDVMNNTKSQQEVPITIADFGSADGSNSIPVLNEVIKEIRQTFGKSKEIVLIFEDRAETNFNALVTTTMGLNPNQRHILNTDEHVSILYSATRMHKKCFVKQSLDLVLSTLSLMYLSKVPCNITNGIFDTEASEEEKVLLNKQFAADYKAFLLNRGEELKHGGKMVIGLLAQFPDGRITEDITGGAVTFSNILRNLQDGGSIAQEEFENVTCPHVLSTTEKELRLPFESSDEDITRLGLAIETLKFKETIYVSGLNDEFIDESKSDNYASSVVSSIKLWLYKTIYHGLDDKRTDEEKHSITEKYFEMVKKFVKGQNSYPPIIMRFAEIVMMKK